VELVIVSGRNGQMTSNHHSTNNLLNQLNHSAPTMSMVLEVAGNGVPGWG